jgi:hypothetical protein
MRPSREKQNDQPIRPGITNKTGKDYECSADRTGRHAHMKFDKKLDSDGGGRPYCSNRKEPYEELIINPNASLSVDTGLLSPFFVLH